MKRVVKKKINIKNVNSQQKNIINLTVINSLRLNYGMGSARSLYLLNLLGINKKLGFKFLNKYFFEILRNIMLQLYLVDDKLKFLKKKQRINYMNIRHYKGIRYALGLPVRGQRTKTNANTVKKFIINKAEVESMLKEEERLKEKLSSEKANLSVVSIKFGKVQEDTSLDF